MDKESAKLDTISESTDDLSSDFFRITSFNRWLSIPLGTWPMHNKNILLKLLSYVQIVFCYSLLFFLLIPFVLHSFLVEKNQQKRVKSYGPLLFCLMGISKYFLLITKRKKLYHYLKRIDADWKNFKEPKDRAIMIDEAKVGRFIEILCAIFMYSGGFFFRTILPFAVPRRVLPDNTTVRPLAVATYQRFINTQKSPNYELTFTAQWFAGLILYTITVAACSTAAVFTLHACAQFNIVTARLKDLVASSLEAPETTEKKLREIIQLHTRALGSVDQIEEIMNEICLVDFVGCTIEICLVTYYLLMELHAPKVTEIAVFTWTFLVLSFLYNIFIFCHVGELLKQQMEKVGTTTYMIDWHDLPSKTANSLILISTISNCPISITAGKMVAVSYVAFTQVLKTSMTCFNLLNSVAV